MRLYWLVRRQILWAVRLFIIGYYENRAVYERTKLGLIWLPLSTFAFVGTLTFVFSSKESSEIMEFFLYVFIGYSLWLFILETITNSTSIIQSQIDFANHNRMSLGYLFLRNLFDRLFRHLLNIGPLFLTVAFLSGDTVGYSILAYGPFLLLMLLTSLSLSYTINFMTLIMPDSEKIIQTGARFLFFISPIFWTVEPGVGGVRNILVTYNPIAYYLSVVRQLFFVEAFSLDKWIIMLIITTVMCITGYICFYYSKGFVRNIS